jgi:hypothetical protein
MRRNIIEELNTADALTRELWVLLNDDELAWEPVYAEVREGPAPTYMDASPSTTPAVVLAIKLRMIGQAMTTLADMLSERHGLGEPHVVVAASTQVRTAQRTTVSVSSPDMQRRSTMGSAHAMQTMNPMWLLTALHGWTMEEAFLEDEQREKLRWQLGQGPIPGWLREHRDEPDEMLSAMLDHVGRRLLECAARRGYKTKPGIAAAGSLPDTPTASEPPEPEPE